MPSAVILRRVTLVRTDVSEEQVNNNRRASNNVSIYFQRASVASYCERYS
jgi:hypothetical protein